MTKAAQRLALGMLALVAIGCAEGDQEPAQLAPELKSYVSAKLDSAEWTAASDGSLSVIDEVITVEVGDDAGKRSFLLTAWNVKAGKSTSISVSTDSLIIGQNIPLDGIRGRASFTSKTAPKAKPTFITSNGAGAGSLTIQSIDTVMKRVIGSFDVHLPGVNITDGKFDARYTAPKPI